MSIQDYWSKHPSEQQKILKQSALVPPHGMKMIDIGKAIEGVNPCLSLYGYGPDGAICRDCVHCRYPLQRNPKAKYWKCDLRKVTHGAATDHRVRWPACGRYEQRTEDYHGG